MIACVSISDLISLNMNNAYREQIMRHHRIDIILCEKFLLSKTEITYKLSFLLEPQIIGNFNQEQQQRRRRRRRRQRRPSVSEKKKLAEGGFDPPTFGLWAQHADRCATLLSVYYHANKCDI